MKTKSNFVLDKLTEQYTLKIPAITKELIDKLSGEIPDFKKRLNVAILMTMAEEIHKAKFDPAMYLSEGMTSLQIEHIEDIE